MAPAGRKGQCRGGWIATRRRGRALRGNFIHSFASLLGGACWRGRWRRACRGEAHDAKDPSPAPGSTCRPLPPVPGRLWAFRCRRPDLGITHLPAALRQPRYFARDGLARNPPPAGLLTPGDGAAISPLLGKPLACASHRLSTRGQMCCDGLGDPRACCDWSPDRRPS